MARLEARSTSMATRVLIISAYPFKLVGCLSGAGALPCPGTAGAAAVLHLLSRAPPNLVGGPVHHLLNLAQFKGLGDEIEDPLLKGLFSGFQGGEAGDHDDFRAGVAFL